jgi:hypothetical protein
VTAIGRAISAKLTHIVGSLPSQEQGWAVACRCFLQEALLSHFSHPPRGPLQATSFQTLATGFPLWSHRCHPTRTAQLFTLAFYSIFPWIAGLERDTNGPWAVRHHKVLDKGGEALGGPVHKHRLWGMTIKVQFFHFRCEPETRYLPGLGLSFLT